MTDGGAVLAKMIAATKSGGAVPDDEVDAAFSISSGKVIRALFDVDSTLENAAITTQTRDQLLKSAPTPGLLLIVESVGGSIGLLSMDAPLINALVELTTGASEKSVCLDQRIPTAIDAALCHDFCERLLSAFPRELTNIAGFSPLADLITTGHETDAARLVFKLENKDFRQLSAKISFQGGTRGGQISLCLPQAIWRNKRNNAALSSNQTWRQQLTANVLGAPLLLRADLDTVALSLSAALSLKPADVVPVSPGALSSIDLVTDRGVGLLTGRLGQINGKKAICASGIFVDGSTISAQGGSRNLAQIPQLSDPTAQTQPDFNDLGTDVVPNIDAFDQEIAS